MLTVLAYTLCLVVLTISADLQLESAMPVIIQKIRPGQTQQSQIVENQSIRYQYSPESRIISEPESGCHIHSAFISLIPMMSFETGLGQGVRKFSFNKNQKSLYQIKRDQITEYRVDWQNKEVKQSARATFNSSCPKNMVQLSGDNSMFVFSCEGIYQFSAGHLEGMQRIILHESLVNAFKVVRFQQLLLQVSSNEGINIYSIDFSMKISKIARVSSFSNHTLHTADAYYRNNKLFVLDHRKGLFIFKRDGSNFIEQSNFELKVQETLQYKLLTMSQNNLYIAFEGNSESVVLECLFTFSKLLLIRYFKGYNSIKKLQIFQNKLLVEDSSRIELLNINRDPRAVWNLANGYSYKKDRQIQQIMYLQDSHFLLLQPNRAEIVHLRTTDNILECSFPQTGNYRIEIESLCETNVNDAFYHVCSQVKRILINVQSATKDNYSWLLMIVGGIFIIVVAVLIYWREEENVKIKKVFRRIREFKQKFQIKAEQVEFQEVDHAYSDQLHARSKNLSEVKGEYEQFDNENEKQEQTQEESEEKKAIECEQHNEEEAVGTERGLTTQ